MTLESFVAEKIQIRSKIVREFLAEFLGIFILMVFGMGANAQSALSRGQLGGMLTVNWAWGLAVGMGVWVSGGVSGGHINPAVSLAMAILGRLQWKKLPVYWLAQYLGSFAASACVYGIYYDAIAHFDGGIRYVTGVNATAGIWATYPAPYLSIAGGFGDQVFGTLLLVLCVMAVTDDHNMTPVKGLVPFCVGLIVFVIGTSYGMNCGYAINPARDFSPRLFTAIAGWGGSVFTVCNYWFWVPIVAPHIGAFCGAVIYLVAIGFHFEEPDDVTDENQKPVQLRELRGHINQDFQLETGIKSNEAARF